MKNQMTETLRYHQNRCQRGLDWIKKNFPNVDLEQLNRMDKYKLGARAGDLLEMWITAKDVLAANEPVREDELAQALRGISGRVSTHEVELESNPNNIKRDLEVGYNVARAYEAQQRLEELSLPFTGTAQDIYKL